MTIEPSIHNNKAPRLRRFRGTVLSPRRSLRIKEMNMKSSAKMTQTQILPHELILEILCLLPPNSLVRFKSVSKLWCESIDDHSFTHNHSRNIISKGGKIIIPRNEEYSEILCGANGLIFERSKLASKYRVRNPLTKHVLDLPDPMVDSVVKQMVYSHAENKYKLYCLYIRKLEGTPMCGGFMILTLETDEIWRNVVIPEFSVGVYEKNGLLTGSLLWVLTGDYQKIVCIEMESEKLSIVDNIPKDFITASGSVSFCSWYNKLSISRIDRNGLGEWNIQVWILEDDKKHIWAERKISINLSCINNIYPEAKEMRFLYVKKDNKMWFSVDSDKHFVGYNIVGKDARAVKIENIDAYKCVKDCYCPSITYLKGMKTEI